MEIGVKIKNQKYLSRSLHLFTAMAVIATTASGRAYGDTLSSKETQKVSLSGNDDLTVAEKGGVVYKK